MQWSGAAPTFAAASVLAVSRRGLDEGHLPVRAQQFTRVCGSKGARGELAGIVHVMAWEYLTLAYGVPDKLW